MDTYRIVPGGFSPEEWIVVSATDDPPDPSTVVGFNTKHAAQAEADRLNALAKRDRTTDKSPDGQGARPHVMAAYRGSHAAFAPLYKKLAE